MSRIDCKPFAEELQAVFPNEWIYQEAIRTGAQQRRRKVDMVAFFWSVVLGFAVSRVRTLAELRRGYERRTGSTIEESSFYGRFGSGFLTLLKRAVRRALEKTPAPAGKLRGHLAAFRDLLLFDATVIRLHDFLAKSYRATRTNTMKSAAKLHVVMSVLGAAPTKLKLTSERVNDQTPWRRIGKWVSGRLLLFDLGYLSFQLFDRIQQNGGFFISRLKTTSNPKIIAENRKWRGRSRTLVGLKLQDALEGLARKIVDVMVEVRFSRRQYKGGQSQGRARFRVVAVWNPDAKKYHVYMTNVPADDLDAEQIAEAYRLRWQVELLFKQLRSHYRLDQLPSRKKVVVETLIYAAILTLIVSRVLMMATRRRAPAGRHVPELRWAAVFAGIASDLLRALVPRPRRRSFASPWDLLLAQAVDPNLGRPVALASVI